MRRLIIVVGIALCFLTSAAHDQDKSAEQAAGATKQMAYEPKPGPLEVRTVEKLVLQDAKRKEDLQLRITYPDAAGPFPVIVFSHGAFGSKDNYLPLVEYWAGYGYVVLQPTHSDSRALGVKPGDPQAFQDWQSRPADISFVLDSLEELADKEAALWGKLDAARIGVGGHSFGANTAQLIGGAKAFPRLAGQEKSFEDQRVKAVLLMSGQGPGEMLTEKSWQEFRRPMLVMSGSKDGPTRTGQSAEWRKKPYELSPDGDKYLVWVEGLDHGYGGITGANFSGRNKPNDDHIQFTKIATLAFWDAYLKDRQAARAYLQSEQLTTFSRGAIQVLHK